ncbi:CAP domain-containing protein [Aquimarina rhabdastrellae]
MKLNLLKVVLISLTYLMLSCSKEEIETIAPEVTNENEFLTYDYTTIEEEILELINDHRSTLGLSTLEIMDIASVEAQKHNEHMITNQEVCHDYFFQRERIIKEATKATNVSENVAFGYNNAASVVNAWLNSPEHKKNLEGDHTYFGISVIQNTEGRYYFTNIFIAE